MMPGVDRGDDLYAARRTGRQKHHGLRTVSPSLSSHPRGKACHVPCQMPNVYVPDNRLDRAAFAMVSKQTDRDPRLAPNWCPEAVTLRSSILIVDVVLRCITRSSRVHDAEGRGRT